MKVVTFGRYIASGRSDSGENELPVRSISARQALAAQNSLD